MLTNVAATVIKRVSSQSSRVPEKPSAFPPLAQRNAFRHGVRNLISDALPFGRLCYTGSR